MGAAIVLFLVIIFMAMVSLILPSKFAVAVAAAHYIHSLPLQARPTLPEEMHYRFKLSPPPSYQWRPYPFIHKSPSPPYASPPPSPPPPPLAKMQYRFKSPPPPPPESPPPYQWPKRFIHKSPPPPF
ncbi:extensin-like [Momordica charantia]|uniref:Extensin-like n=1 Tax=Momordica charantia TaxID=3673 RepID=A0A6J1CJD0_MOMCH|nr:extensin-like [Momordica charantia]